MASIVLEEQMGSAHHRDDIHTRRREVVLPGSCEKHENEEKVGIQNEAGNAETGSGCIEGNCKVKCRSRRADKSLQYSGSDRGTTKVGFVSNRPPSAVPFRNHTNEDGPDRHNKSEQWFHGEPDSRIRVKAVLTLSVAIT